MNYQYVFSLRQYFVQSFSVLFRHCFTTVCVKTICVFKSCYYIILFIVCTCRVHLFVNNSEWCKLFELINSNSFPEKLINITLVLTVLKCGISLVCVVKAIICIIGVGHFYTI